MRKKQYIIENLEILDAAAEGKAVGKCDGLTVFVSGLVPGDVADVMVFKKKKTYAEARPVKLIKSSPLRVEPSCSHFGLCGGCKWQMLRYEQQLFFKQKQVTDNFEHLGHFPSPQPAEILASEKQYYYRNKLEFTFTHQRWLSDDDMQQQNLGNTIETRGMGFHIPAKFDKVLDIAHCYLQADPSNAIRQAVKQFAITHDIAFYNLRLHEGILRNLIVRTSSAHEVMVILSFTEKNEATTALLQFIADTFPQITSLQYVVNQKFNDTITDLPIEVFKGKPFIMEKMGDLQFKIGPTSFYQTNTDQAVRLYQVAKNFADIHPTDIVYDLYTGTGTIANFVARNAQKVVGIEYVDAAIEDAKENSKINGIANTAFYAGDMAKVLTQDFVRANGRPQVVITDPPRAGMHPAVIEQLIETAPHKIVYVSCNPATQARDITLLAEHYTVAKIQPVDMFPHTQHVENVVLLIKK